MVTIKDGCGCGTASCCSWKEKLEEAYKRATASVNKVGDDAGSIYYPDGTGYVKLPLPTRAQIAQIQTNADDITTLKADVVRIDAKDNTQDGRLTDVEATDRSQNELIADNANRLNILSNELITTEASVAKNQGDIANLKGETQTLGRSLVSDVIMTDGTTAGSVQVSIEKEDGALITSANYKWGRDIGVRLEAGTQAGYIKTVISLSDGTELVSNEYKIVEVLESDVYVTAITLVPDMTAGTIGGNISYSNGTTQAINSVSVPTAPGVTSAIEALQTRMTAVESKNTTQDGQITALDTRVKAIEDTPGVGQFAAGKLGTIAGSAADGRIAAEDDGTGSVNGWSALKDRVSTAEQEIVDLNGMVTGKVEIMQGAANAGKALIVGPDGNVSPGNVSGGEVWEEVDLNNWTNDWVAGDRIKIQFIGRPSASSRDWNTAPSVSDINLDSANISEIFEIELQNEECYSNSSYQRTTNILNTSFIRFNISKVSNFNSSSDTIIELTPIAFNGGGSSTGTVISVNRTNLSTYVSKMWRLKK